MSKLSSTLSTVSSGRLSVNWSRICSTRRALSTPLVRCASAGTASPPGVAFMAFMSPAFEPRPAPQRRGLSRTLDTEHLQGRIHARADVDLHAEVEEGAAERREPDDRVEPAGRRAHVRQPDEVAGALPVGEHHAGLGPREITALGVVEIAGQRDRGDAGGHAAPPPRPELEAHRARTRLGQLPGVDVPADDLVDPLVEGLVERRLEAVDVAHR